MLSSISASAYRQAYRTAAHGFDRILANRWSFTAFQPLLICPRNRKYIHYSTLNPNPTIRSIENIKYLAKPIKISKSSRRSLFIRTEPTPNPDSLKFLPDKPLLDPGQTADFPDAVAAARSPLAKMLFRIDGVKGVFIGSSWVTVTKDVDREWDSIKSIVFADLMEFFCSGEPVLTGEMSEIIDTTVLPDDSEDVALIKSLIETRIRPSIQDDGGDVTYLGFIDGVVFIKLKGSCTSCPSSTTTVKSGIQKMLTHWTSAVTGVVSVESEEDWERISNNATGSLDIPARATQEL